MNYPRIVKELREKLMLSQHEFADFLGVAFVSVNRWENGRTKPVYVVRRKLAELCKEHKVKIEE